MASMGKRVREVFAEIVHREAKSIQDTDELRHYGFSRANYFSLLEKMEDGLEAHGLLLEISERDNPAIMGFKTVKNLEDFITRASRKQRDTQGGESDGN